jgi:CRISPR-associated protein Csx16
LSVQKNTTWIVTRHQGAQEFILKSGFSGQHVAHLDMAQLAKGDRVVGNLPIHIAAQLNSLGIDYWHLCVTVDKAQRGQELTAATLKKMGAYIGQFYVTPMQLK